MEWDRVATLAVVLDRLDPKDRPKFQKLWQMAHDELEQLQENAFVHRPTEEGMKRWPEVSSQTTVPTPVSLRPREPVQEELLPPEM